MMNRNVSKHRMHFLIGGLLCVVLIIWVAVIGIRQKRHVWISGNDLSGWYHSSQDLAIAQYKAIEGNRDEATKLGAYCGIRGNERESIYWYEIAAENGDAESLRKD